MGRNRYLLVSFYGSGPESRSLAFVRSNSNVSNVLDILDWITLVAHGMGQHAKSLKVQEWTRDCERLSGGSFRRTGQGNRGHAPREEACFWWLML
ncbi:hypothetical protein HAV15_001352 [Penicillium sp. str. |nr:hypothetical protein HAV15_001352 [Penicillium sp. str. \